MTFRIILKDLKKEMPGFTLSAAFNIPQGGRAGLAGPSGSGKTTLLRLIAGLERADGGAVFLGADNITDWSIRRREIGFVFQEAALFPYMNVLENAAFGLKMKGIPKEEREERALSWLDRVGLRKRALSSVSELSGGERQRIAFVRALIWEPRLLLLDEPFSALDRELRKQLGAELMELVCQTPLILVSHDESDLTMISTMRLGFVSNKNERRIQQV